MSYARWWDGRCFITLAFISAIISIREHRCVQIAIDLLVSLV